MNHDSESGFPDDGSPPFAVIQSMLRYGVAVDAQESLLLVSGGISGRVPRYLLFIGGYRSFPVPAPVGRIANESGSFRKDLAILL